MAVVRPLRVKLDPVQQSYCLEIVIALKKEENYVEFVQTRKAFKA